MNEQLPQNKIYELVGQLYLQLYAAHESHDVLVKQVGDLVQQNNQMQALLNDSRTSPTQEEGPTPPPQQNVEGVMVPNPASAVNVTEQITPG